MSETILSLRNLTRQFKGVLAVDHVDMNLKKGGIYGLIGTNGAGKSTVINMISGSIPPTEGEIFFGERAIGRLSASDRARAGIARTFQNLRLFSGETAMDNVITASQITRKYNLLDALISSPRYRREEKRFAGEAYEALQIMGIEQYADFQADNLPYGLQRRLEIARCLAIRPKLLLLDEPAAGMNPQETQALMDMIRFVQEHFDMTILLIEHDMKLVSGICEELTVLNFGEVLAQGKTSGVLSQPQVITAYLGE